MKKFLVGLMVAVLMVPCLLAVQAESTVTIDVSRDARASSSFWFPGGPLGVKIPERVSSTITIEVVEENLPAGAMPLMPGVSEASYVLRMFCSEESGTVIDDGSASTNDFTAATDATNFTSATGIGGHGFALDGTADYLTRADDADFDFDATTDFAIGCWFTHNTISTDPDVLFAKADGTGNSETGYSCRMNADGTLSFDTSDDSGATRDVASTTATYDDNLPHLLWVVRDASANNYIYVDGTQAAVSVVTNAAATLANAKLMTIGSQITTTNLWAGSIDSFEIITAIAPNAANILTHYNRAVAALDPGVVKSFDGGLTTIGSVSGAAGTAAEYWQTNALDEYVGFLRIKSSATQTVDETIRVFYEE